MRDYNPNLPLIYIHVPKTAGVSVRNILEFWFPENSFAHYYNIRKMKLPKRVAAEILCNRENPPIIYGHFNRDRGFGVEDYYPDIQQFMTILREPLEMHISRYHFQKARVMQGRPVPNDVLARLELHVLEAPLNMLSHFPRVITHENYKDIIEEYFIYIGLFGTLSRSLSRMAGKLERKMPDGIIPHLNKSHKTEYLSNNLREAFRERWPLEYAVYEYVYQKESAFLSVDPD